MFFFTSMSPNIYRNRLKQRIEFNNPAQPENVPEYSAGQNLHDVTPALSPEKAFKT